MKFKYLLTSYPLILIILSAQPAVAQHSIDWTPQTVSPSPQLEVGSFDSHPPALELESIKQRLHQLECCHNQREVFTSRQGTVATFGLRVVQPRGVHFPVHINGQTTHSTYDFDFDYVASPWVSLEAINDEGFGIRGTYWYVEADGRATPENAIDPPFGVKLKSHVADFELTQDVDFNFLSVVYTMGFRYLDSSRTSDRPNIQVRTPSFDGIGPMVSYEVRRPISDTFSLYHSLRGAVLYGDETHIVIAPGGIPDPHSKKGFIPVGDVEVGAELHEAFGSAMNLRVSWIATAYRDIAFMGLHFHASLNW